MAEVRDSGFTPLSRAGNTANTPLVMGLQIAPGPSCGTEVSPVVKPGNALQ